MSCVGWWSCQHLKNLESDDSDAKRSIIMPKEKVCNNFVDLILEIRIEVISSWAAILFSSFEFLNSLSEGHQNFYIWTITAKENEA